MLANVALLSSFACMANGLSFSLSMDGYLYTVEGFINTGSTPNFEYSTMSGVAFLVDTLNTKSFVLSDASTCSGCPIAPGVAPGMFQAQPQLGMMSFGKNSKVYGKQGVTEIGIAMNYGATVPDLNWLQQEILVTRASNVEVIAGCSGSLGLGRSERAGRYESALGSIAGLLDGDSTFCLDIWFLNELPTMIFSSSDCNAIEADSCGMLVQLPIYKASDPTWNVAMTSFHVGSSGDTAIPFLSQVIIDTTKHYAIFPYDYAKTLANAIGAACGAAVVNEIYYADGFYGYTFNNSTEVTADLLINFSSYDPYTSDQAKYYQVSVDNYVDWDWSDDTLILLSFYGSKDACLVGNVDGYKSYLGAAWMRKSYFGFHPDYITIIQEETVNESVMKKKAIQRQQSS